MPELIGLVSSVVLLIISVAINGALAARLALFKRTEETGIHNRTRVEAVEIRMAVVESRLGGIERALSDGFIEVKLLLREHIANDKRKT